MVYGIGLNTDNHFTFCLLSSDLRAKALDYIGFGIWQSATAYLLMFFLASGLWGPVLQPLTP